MSPVSTTPSPTIDTELVATRLLYEMLGRRWVPPMQATDVYPLHREIILTGRPVSDVLSVTGWQGEDIPAGDGITTGYQLYGNFRLRLPHASVDSASYPYAGSAPNSYTTALAQNPSFFRKPEVTIEYLYGCDPPEQIRYAIWALAHQLDLALANDSECKLPKRVTSITRQGVSMTVLDSMQFLDKGYTGLPEVDQAIAVFNPTPGARFGSKPRARARMFSEKHPPARRLSVQMLEDTLLVILQGSDWSASWPIVDDNGAPQDLSGWTGDMQARSYSDNSLLYEWSTGNGRLTMSGSNVTVVVPAATSSGWTFDRAKFQLELTSPSSVVSRVDAGRIRVSAEVVV